MQPVPYGKVPVRALLREITLPMRLLALFFTVVCMQAAAKTDAQGITLSVQNASLEKVLLSIETQSKFHFVYSQEAMAISRPVNADLRNENINQVLKIVFGNQPLTYVFNDLYIVLKIVPPQKEVVPRLEVRGTVTNEEGQPLAGITIAVKGTSQKTITDAMGEFILYKVEPSATIIISGAETTAKEIELKGRTHLAVTVNTRVNELDQVVMTAYGSTTKKLNLGNITKVTAAEIDRHPVSNPLASLQGRVPGLIVSQTSGLPGAAFKVEIRGRTSLDQRYSRNDPLFIIDGVPFEPGNISTNQVTNAANKPNEPSQGGLSPLNNISPSDIESIEVLKDADATAIYGSRGANGVILITTRKGKAGKLNLNLNVSAGFSRVTRTLDMLNTTQYLAMRREAFANDGIVPGLVNAPDLVTWDTARYTDYKKMFQGGTARNQAVQLAATGGTGQTQFRLGMGYTRQTNIFSNELSDKIISGHVSINHATINGKLRLSISGSYSVDDNKMIRDDLSKYKNLPPHVRLKDEAGNLKWNEGGVEYTSIFGVVGNPLSLLEKKYNSQNTSFMSNIALSYRPGNFNLRLNFGYSSYMTDEIGITPKTSMAPSSTANPSSNFANSNMKSLITEPQVEYKMKWGGGTFTLLAGGTLQEKLIKSQVVSATNYTSDILLRSMAAAGTLTAANDYVQYRYMAAFGRVSWNYAEKYLANISYRLDGSSRFGPEKRFASFGAAGVGWIFSKEKFMRSTDRIISFGKLRASYGITGNDQIGDYRYIDLWAPISPTYQGVSGLSPSNLFNPDYNWERNRKAEIGLELGLLKDRILFSASWYRNRSGNQLILYRLPVQTGFSGVVKNLDALVENSGWECVLSYRTKGQISYAGSLNISVPRNKLISFPGLATSSYSTVYREGMSLSVSSNLHYLGVNDTTGLYTFSDVNKDGLINAKDYVFGASTDARWYGGSQHELRFKNFELAVLFEFRNQDGSNYLERVANDFPGKLGNQPAIVLQRWQKPGDRVAIQRFSQNTGSPAGTANSNMVASDGTITDAGYIRCKNISLQYSLSQKMLKRMKVSQMRLFVLSQNPFVITRYKGSDPETQDFFVLPPLKTMVVGINLNF